MATAPINPALLLRGPGIFYSADLGSAEPSHTVAAGKFSAAPWGGAWLPVGSTDDGHEFSDSADFDGIQVAESYYDLQTVTTGRTASWTCSLAEINKTNLRLSLNGGTVTNVSTLAGTEMSTITPPTVGNEVGKMIGWQSEDDTVRLIGYSALQVGALGVTFRKGADKATLSLEWRLNKPTVGDPYKVFLAGAGRVS